MSNSNWLGALFAAIDSKNSEEFVTFITEDCQFRFGNGPLVEGRANIAAYVDGFFKAIAGLSHSLLESRDIDDGVVCHGTVTYTRWDKTTLTVPFANIFKSSSLDDPQANISQYLIFADTSGLFQ